MLWWGAIFWVSLISIGVSYLMQNAWLGLLVLFSMTLIGVLGAFIVAADVAVQALDN